MKKLSFMIVGLGIFLAVIMGLVYVGEQFTRYWFQDITTTADNASYFSRHWYLKELGRDLVDLNSLGYRDPEPDVNKPDGVTRIAVVGDSYTFGPGIAQAARFTDRLNAYFKQRDEPVELLNLGRNGAGPRHYLLALESHLKLQPDFVLLQWFVNDFEVKTSNPDMLRPSPGNLIPRRFSKYHYHYHRTSTLYYVLNRGWQNLQYSLGITDSYKDYMLRRFQDENGVESRNALIKLTQVLNAYQREDIPIGIVLFPMFMPDLGTDAYPFSFLHERVLTLCRQRRLPCLDLRQTFAPHVSDSLDKLTVNQFDGHPSSYSNQLASEAILEFFNPTWADLSSSH